jgi:MFS family permease
MDRRWVLVGVAFVTSLACMGVVAATGKSVLVLYVVGGVYGGLSFTVYSLSVAHTNDFSDPERRIQTAAALLIAYGIGASLGPLVASAAMGQIGPRGLFMYSAIVTGLLALFGVYRMRRRAAKTKEERSQIISLPGGQYTAGQLYASMRNQMDRDLARMAGGYRNRD